MEICVCMFFLGMVHLAFQVGVSTIDELNREHIAEIAADKNVPDFQAGDTLKVNVKVKEGTRERIQAYEGVCIARSGSGLNASFTVRKISYG